MNKEKDKATPREMAYVDKDNKLKESTQDPYALRAGLHVLKDCLNPEERWTHIGELLIHYGKPCQKCGKTRKVTMCDSCYGNGGDDL